MPRSAMILGLVGLIGMTGALASGNASAVLPPEAMNGYTVGDYAFDFPALDQNGNSVSLYQYAGSYIVLDYCAVWCENCTVLTPVLDSISTALNGTGVPQTSLVFLLQDNLENPSTVHTAQLWANHFHLAMPVLNLGGAANSVVDGQFLNYGATAGQEGGGFPTFLILSPSLKILSLNVGIPVSLDQMPAFVNQVIQADLTSDPASGLAEATVLTQRRISSALPFALKGNVGTDIVNALSRIKQNVALQRTDLACAQTAALTFAVTVASCSATSVKACPSGIKVLDPTYSAQLSGLVADARAALQCAAPAQ